MKLAARRHGRHGQTRWRCPEEPAGARSRGPRRHSQYRVCEGKGTRKRGRHARPGVTRRHGRAYESASRGDLPRHETTPLEGGTQGETRQGISAADAAKAAGAHLVFTSAGSANRRTGIPHFDSKYEVEEHIAKIGVRATVLAPVYFMENLHFGKEQLAKGVYATPLPPTRQLAQVAVADIGAVTVRLLEDPGRFAGEDKLRPPGATSSRAKTSLLSSRV